MKNVLVLVVILHLCDSFNTSLNAELMSQLKTLKRELNRTKLRSSVLPSKYMSENPHVCWGVFFRELRVVLSNLPVHKCCINSIRMLLANLDSLGPIPENDQKCRMTIWPSKKLPVDSYIDFITKLNT